MSKHCQNNIKTISKQCQNNVKTMSGQCQNNVRQHLNVVKTLSENIRETESKSQRAVKESDSERVKTMSKQC